MAVCTENGDIIICDENAEFLNLLADSPNKKLNQPWKPECITSYSKGFIVGGENCTIFVYKSTNDNQNPFELVQKFCINKS